MINFLITLLLLGGLSLAYGQNNHTTNIITIQITGLKNNSGMVGISIFISSEGFPNTTSKSQKMVFVPINNQTVKTVIEGLPFGVYAISAFHDENNNKKIDENFIGIPKEGVGVSNNARGFMGPPKYEQAKFKFSQTGQVISITIHYL